MELLEDRSLLATFGTVQGIAFLDANRNGILDSRDARLPGVSVTLVGTTSGAGDNTSINVTVKTNASGLFQFTNVPEGTYTLQTGTVPGLNQGTAQSFSGVAITTNGQLFTHNFVFQGGLLPRALSMRQFVTNASSSNFPYSAPGQTPGIANHTPTVVSKPATVNTTTSANNTVISLAGNFTDNNYSNSQITFHITNGTTTSTIKLILFDKVAPRTVANFLDYVTSDRYDGTIFHRLAKVASGGLGVLQGGALDLANAAGTDLVDVAVFPTGSTVPNEFSSLNKNIAGTIAMAQSTGINSATNQFFFNTVDNSAALDPQKFAVFGKIADAASMAALNALAQTATQDLSSTTFATAHPTALLNNVPLTNYAGPIANFPNNAVADNYMRITDITVDRRTEFLTYSLVGVNGGGNSAIANASITNEYITIDPVAAGTTTFTIQATDRYGATVTTTLDVVVTGNHAPIANDGTISTNEDNSVPGSLPATDPDAGNTLTFTIESQPSKGTVTLNNVNTGAYTFNPGTAFQGLNQGQSEQVTFTYKATDNLGIPSQVKTITVTVTGLDDAPVANDGTATTDQNSTVNGTLTASDVDTGDTIASYSIVTQPAKGSVTLTNAVTGAFTFDPETDFINLGQGQSEPVTFTFKATDSDGLDSLPKTITVTVNGLNDLPTANDGTLDATASGTTTGTLTGSDPDNGDTIKFSLVSQPAKGSVNLDDEDTGDYTFDPGTDFASLGVGQTEDVTFTFKVIDSFLGESTIATITVTVTG